MKSINALRLSSVAAGIGFLICAPSFADDNRYGYGGLGFGKSWSNIDDEGITLKLLPPGGTTVRDEQGFAFKVFGGYQFNRNFAIEGGYFHLGKFGFNSTVVPAGTLKGQIELQGVNIDLVGTLPLNTRWALLGRAGIQYAETNDTFTSSGSIVVFNANPTQKEFNYKAGVGVQYTVNPYLLLRLEGERYRVNDALSNHGDINVASLSVVFPFRHPAPEPVPVAPAYVPPPPPPPAPEPVVQPAPPPPPPPAVVAPRRRVSFSADSLFAFDKATISPAGKQALDVFAKELKDTRYQSITVEGHTDRLGSEQYNEKLSLQRAEVVKGYLADAGGIPIAKLRTEGKGETMPVTKPGECKGEKRTPDLIKCLQPDRRVEVEVTGTQAP